MKAIQAVLLLTCSVAALSCARDTKTTPASTSSATPVISPTATPFANPTAALSTEVSESGDISNPNFEGTIAVTEKKRGERPPATLKTVRTATHEGFDRIVFKFAESGLPGYRIEYTDKPAQKCGSGEAVSVRGNARMLIQIKPANAHTEAGQVTMYPERERSLSFPVMRDLKLTCDFEAEVQWVLGLASQKPYRVVELLNPARLVVDIKQ